MKKARTKSTPKSQSEKAADKKSKALERAGTAVLEGKKDKAKKILDKQKKAEAKKPSAKQAVEVLSEAHTLEMQLTAIEHEIDGVKEHYKELKSRREKLVFRIREEIRDMGQGRLPFQDGVAAKNGSKSPKGETKPTKGETPPATNGAAPKDGETAGDQIDRELSEGAPTEKSQAADKGQSNPRFGELED